MVMLGIRRQRVRRGLHPSGGNVGDQNHNVVSIDLLDD